MSQRRLMVLAGPFMISSSGIKTDVCPGFGPGLNAYRDEVGDMGNVGINLSVIKQPATEETLRAYSKVSIEFTATSRLRVDLIDDGLGGVRLVEESVTPQHPSMIRHIRPRATVSLVKRHPTYFRS